LEERMPEVTMSQVLASAWRDEIPRISEMLNRNNALLEMMEAGTIRHSVHDSYTVEAPTNYAKQFICKDCGTEDYGGKMVCDKCKSRDIEVVRIERVPTTASLRSIYDEDEIPF
jgi:hypothetical protein